jgi:hypothetical protein
VRDPAEAAAHFLAEYMIADGLPVNRFHPETFSALFRTTGYEPRKNPMASSVIRMHSSGAILADAFIRCAGKERIMAHDVSLGCSGNNGDDAAGQIFPNEQFRIDVGLDRILPAVHGKKEVDHSLRVFRLKKACFPFLSGLYRAFPFFRFLHCLPSSGNLLHRGKPGPVGQVRDNWLGHKKASWNVGIMELWNNGL